MKKWHVDIHCTIQAETRHEIWQIAEALCEKHFRGLANVHSVSSEPVDDDYIAVNEPIKKRSS